MADRLTQKAMFDMKRAEVPKEERWEIRIGENIVDPWILAFNSFYMPGEGLVNYLFMREEFDVIQPDGIEQCGLKGDCLVRTSPEKYTIMTKQAFKEHYGKEYLK